MGSKTTRGLIGFVALVGGMALVGQGDAGEAAPGSITFSARNMVLTAEGSFRGWHFVRVAGDREHPEDGVVEVEVDVASIDTGNEGRDDHLRRDDFFDVERFPTAHVKLYGATASGESADGNPRYGVSLDVRIRDVEKTVRGEFEVVSMTPPTVEGTVVLNRVDFGVGGAYRGWNPLSVREDVQVRFRAVLPAES